jgi:glutamine synthetase
LQLLGNRWVLLRFVMTRAPQILSELRNSNASKVKVAVTDIDGILRGKYIHIDKFASALESGFGFCDVIFGWDSGDVCYDNAQFTGWHTGYPDALARLDLNTFRRVPWDNQVPFFLGDFYDAHNEPLAVCPRQLLKRIIERCNALGFTSKFALEFEFFNFNETPETLAAKNYVNPEPLTPGMFGYSILRAGQHREYFNALMDELAAFGVPIEGLHTETGPGVYEAAILYADPLEAADRAVLFKTAAKEIGARFGIMPSFMAKWNAKLPGCSGHIHQSLWKNEQNVFHDNKERLSETFKHYLAGQMFCLADVLPFFAPSVNSYKRLVEGMWAPTQITWGIDNRTTAFRAIPGGAKSTRLETRVSGSDVNPYLAIAAALASGLYGIEKKLPLEPATTGSGYAAKGKRLPRNLNEAADKMHASKIARELFGETFVDHFAATRQWEWRQFQMSVTNWEMQRYFEII